MSSTGSELSVCARITRRLAERVGEERFSRLFATGVNWKMKGDQLDVEVGNGFVADWVKRSYSSHISEAAATELGRPVQLRVLHVDPQAETRIKGESGQQDTAIPQRHEPADRATGQNSTYPESDRQGRYAATPGRTISRGRQENSHGLRHGDGDRNESAPAKYKPAINRRVGKLQRGQTRLDLESFVTGRANRLAYEAARAVARLDESANLNPLFIYGPCGVGKTHLLVGIFRRRKMLFPRQKCWYTTGEQFTNQFVAALKSRRLESFRARLRDLDLLCIDDVHFLTNKQATQAELLNTLKMVDLSGASLVLASDEHPHHVRRFTDQLVSRFMSGMVAEIETPDPELCTQLARDFAHRRGLRLSETVTEALAREFPDSPRELQGALMKLEVVHRLQGNGDRPSSPLAEIGMCCYRQAFPPGLKPRRRPVPVEVIIRCTCEMLNVTPSDVLGKCRHRRVVAARSLSAYLARSLTTFSFPEIAERMNRPNHSTIVTACQRIEKQLQSEGTIVCEAGGVPVPVSRLLEKLKAKVLKQAEESE